MPKYKVVLTLHAHMRMDTVVTVEAENRAQAASAAYALNDNDPGVVFAPTEEWEAVDNDVTILTIEEVE